MLTLAWSTISDVLNQSDVLGINTLASSFVDELDIWLDISGEILGEASLGQMGAITRCDL